MEAIYIDTPLSSLWFISLFTILGAVVGSFLNVVIYRLPIIMVRDVEPELKNDGDSSTAQQDVFNCCLPSSHCPHCGHAIPWYLNIPLISWCLLRGRTHCCCVSIGLNYILTEAATTLIFLVGVLLCSNLVSLVGMVFYFCILLVLTQIDIKHKLLPDVLTLSLLWGGLIFSCTGYGISTESAIIGAICGYLSLWFVYTLFLMLTKKEGLGRGDIKFMAALGAWLGWQSIPEIILMSSSLCMIFTLLSTARSRRGDRMIAFGPWIAVAGGVVIVKYYCNGVMIF